MNYKGPLLVVLAFVGCVESTTFTPLAPTVPVLRLPMNNAYLGSVHSSPLRPRFVWEPSASESAGDIRYEIQLSTDRTFNGDKIEVSTFETSYQPDTALPVSLVAPVGARYFWRVSACLRDSCSEYTRPWYVNVGRVVKDYNGDGYSDVASGARGMDTFGVDRGGIVIDLGGAEHTMDGVPDSFLAPSPFADEAMGRVVGAAGDVNGDGFSDLIVGIPDGSSSARSIALVYMGGEGLGLRDESYTLLANDRMDSRFGGSAGGISDVNGDGYDDVFVLSSNDFGDSAKNIQIYFGGEGRQINAKPDGALALENWDARVAAGDVNGDGFADLVISNASDSTEGSGAGAVHIYMGGLSDVIELANPVSVFGSGVGDSFGESISSGDFNGDGFSDIAVGNYRPPDVSGGQSGKVEVFLGSNGEFGKQRVATIVGRGINNLFGSSLAEAVDMNGDGCLDLLVGSAADPVSRGAIFLYLGCESDGFETTSDVIFEGPRGVFFGEILSAAGDVNGDGFADFSAGLPIFDSVRGRVDTFFGGSTVDTAVDATMLGLNTGDVLGEL